MHLFVSFMLKAVAVFIKDVVLYDVGATENSGETENCKSSVSTLGNLLSAAEHSHVHLISDAVQFIDV